MARFRVGCVPYVNAVPLVWEFERLGESSPVEILYDVPSRLPAMLESGQVDAILVSSFYAMTTPGTDFAKDVCIGSEGPVESVRLLSKAPIASIRTLALDKSSLTSNELCLYWLRTEFGIEPEIVKLEPEPEAMLSLCDACLVIGDVGMTAIVPGARSLDLGQAWTDLTGLPFVWALWTSVGKFPPLLAELLAGAYAAATADTTSWESVINLAASRVTWHEGVVERYLTRCVRFQYDRSAETGLHLFASVLRRPNGLT